MKKNLIFSLFILFTIPTFGQDWLITQDDWGGTDSVNIEYEHTISHITIHHGGEIFPDDKNTAEYLRNLQSWSRSSKNWVDVPYHFIVDRKGEIYEGRPLNYRGDTNTTYDPTGHALVMLLGNFEEQELNPEQIVSLKIVTKYLADQKSVPTTLIKTHKDYAETLCPGKKLSTYLGTQDWIDFLSEISGR